ncbi:MAG: DUF1800 family protein, partial [Rhodospirillales bacterium]
MASLRRRGTLTCVLLATTLLALQAPANAADVSNLAAGGTTARAPASQRAQVQYFLRRFAFSAPPETVTSLLGTGIPAWLTIQDNWQALDDSGSILETLPTQLVNGGLPDSNIFERAVLQHMILTPRQLQAKLELHWLDHFSVGLENVGDPALMYHYDQAIRANALGNFATLLTAVAQEGAMLIWLNNNYNAGSEPNENFAREVMQLYSMGIYTLNQDGSIKLGKNGQPALNYNQKDVEALAKAMTGYGVVYDNNNNNPQTRFSVQYFPGNHYSGPLKYFGKSQKVPTDGTAIAYVMQQLATRPSTAPFEAKELLQRFVTEDPPAQYISDIAAVWESTKRAPDQIAQVITAVVNHPDFNSYYNGMLKQPAELVLGALREVPGTLQATANVAPGGSLLSELNGLGQQLFYPATVFSFYRPGYLATTANTGTVLDRTGVFANITNAQPSGAYTDTYIDIPTLRTRIGSTHGEEIATYLLDAMLDGGSANLQSILRAYLGKTPSDNQIRGAIWLLLNAPDYAVN